jgi:hypothetical protein
MRIFLIASGVVLAGMIAGVALLRYAPRRPAPRAEPYPTFMADYPSSNGSFAEFVAKAFPVGSDAKTAISQITTSSFKVTKASSDSVELLWNRYSGPCRQQFSIVVNQNADGAIAKIDGESQRICY